jgi:aminopeptidase-like protein
LIEAFRLLPESPDLFLNEPPVRYWTFRKGRELIQLKPIVSKLHPLNRTIVSDDYDRSLDYLTEVLRPFGGLKIHSIPGGSTAWSWKIPSRWRLYEAYIEHDGHRILDLWDNVLHVVSWSLPIDREVGIEELRAHLHTLSDRPRVVPYEFKYYELDWGFCMTHEQACSLPEGRYHAVIRSEYVRDNLNVGEFTLKGTQDKGILITTHLDHPAQANDGLSSCAVAVGLIQRLAKRDLNHTCRIIFQPENIGTTAYLFANQQQEQ